MKRIRNFVKNTFKNYPKEEREHLVESITEMLIEKVEDLVENGYSHDEAVDKAVIEFGDINDFEENIPKQKKKFRIKKLKHYRNDIFFSIGGTLLIIGMLVFTNLYYTDVIWFVLPTLAVMWWPLATIYRYLNKKESERGENDE